MLSPRFTAQTPGACAAAQRSLQCPCPTREFTKGVKALQGSLHLPPPRLLPRGGAAMLAADEPESSQLQRSAPQPCAHSGALPRAAGLSGGGTQPLVTSRASASGPCSSAGDTAPSADVSASSQHSFPYLETLSKLVELKIQAVKLDGSECHDQTCKYSALCRSPLLCIETKSLF